MKILITGGAGYIGSVLVPKLLEEGHKVTVYDNLIFSGEQLLPYFSNPNFKLIRGDITNIKKLKRYIRATDAVVHMGALVFTGGEEFSEEINDVNYTATTNIVMECIRNNVDKFIFLSTCSVYGETDKVVDEDSERKGTNAYADSKIKTEDFLLNPMIVEKLNPIILRLATVFGLSPRMRFDLTVNSFCKEGVIDKKIEVHNANAWRPGIHIEDVTDLIVGVCNELDCKKDLKYNVFNIGSDALNFQKKDIVDIISHLVPITTTNKTHSGSRNYKVSFKRMKEVFDFEPKYTLNYGIEEMVDAIKTRVFINPNDMFYNNLDTYTAYYKWRREN